MECGREFSVPRQLRICARAGAQGGETARFQREEVLDGPRGKVLWYEHLAFLFSSFFCLFKRGPLRALQRDRMAEESHPSRRLSSGWRRTRHGRPTVPAGVR